MPNYWLMFYWYTNTTVYVQPDYAVYTQCCYFDDAVCFHMFSTSADPMGSAWSPPPTCFSTNTYCLLAGSLASLRKMKWRRRRQKVKKMIAMHDAEAVLPAGCVDGAHTTVSTTGKHFAIDCERVGMAVCARGE